MKEPVHLSPRAAAQQEALTRPTLDGRDSGDLNRQRDLDEQLKTPAQKEARKLFDQGKISEEVFREKLGLPKI